MSRTAASSAQPDVPDETHARGDVLVGGREREPWRHRPLAVAGLGLLGLAASGAALWGMRSGPTAAPRPISPATAHATVSSAPGATQPTRPRSTELATTVSVGHVRVAGLPVAEQINKVSQELQGSAVQASYDYLPDAGQGGRPVGVRVQFDRLLTATSTAAFLSALDRLDGAAVEVEEAPGTTVDIDLPVVPGQTCVPDASSPDALLLAKSDIDVVAAVLHIFGLGAVDGVATISYTGPRLSPADLQSVSAALAHSCGRPVTQVSLLRHQDEN